MYTVPGKYGSNVFDTVLMGDVLSKVVFLNKIQTKIPVKNNKKEGRRYTEKSKRLTMETTKCDCPYENVGLMNGSRSNCCRRFCPLKYRHRISVQAAELEDFGFGMCYIPAEFDPMNCTDCRFGRSV